MTIRHKYIIAILSSKRLVCLLCLLLSFFGAVNAYAVNCLFYPTNYTWDGPTPAPGSYNPLQPPPATTSDPTNPSVYLAGSVNVAGIDNAGVPIYPNTPYTGITYRIVECIKYAMAEVTTVQFAQIRDTTDSVVATVLTLYIIFFGLRVVFGDLQNFKGDTMVMLFTLFGVAYFAIGVGVEEYVTIMLATQEALSNIMVSNTLEHNLCDYKSVWRNIDCTMAYILGADPIAFKYPGGVLDGAGGDGILGGAGIADDDFQNYGGMAVLPFQAGSPMRFVPFNIMMGSISWLSIVPGSDAPFTDFFMLLFLLTFIIIYMISVFAQALIIFITSLIALTFLGLLGPLIVPMYLFQVTRSIFTQWFTMMLSYIIQPGIVLAFVGFMIYGVHFIITGPCAAGGCGLAALYRDFEGGTKTKVSFLGSATATAQGGNSNLTGNQGLAQNKGSSQNTINTPFARFPPETIPEVHQAKMYLLIQTLLVLAIFLAAISHFMINVMEFGAQLTGLVASPIFKGKKTNIAHRTKNLAMGAMRAATKKK